MKEIMEYPYYKKILFCTDFSENADYAFDFAYGIAKRDQGLLYILHVIPENFHETFFELLIPRNTVNKLHTIIKEDVKRRHNNHYAKKIGNTITYKIVTKSGREDEQILTFAHREGIDIMVIGTHGRTGIEHAFFGSVAEKVLRHSPFPVLVIPCRKKREQV